MNGGTKNRLFNTNRHRGDNLELNSFNLQSGRIVDTQKNYRRTTILANQSVVDGTERIIAEGVNTLGLLITFPATARLLSIASTSVNDTALGSGGRTVLIEGLDANNDDQEEVITLNGQTPVNTIKTWNRINIFELISSGSSNTNEGIMYCSDNTDTFVLGVPQNRVYNICGIGETISKTGIFSLARNKKALFRFMLASTDISGASNRLVFNFKRTSKGLTSDKTRFLTETFYLDRTAQIDVSWFRRIDGTDDVELSAFTTGGSAAISAKVDIIVFDT